MSVKADSAAEKHIFLIGLMGAGKTTVARQLARLLDWPFIDSDAEIEKRTGVSIPVIFEIEGELGFRKREKKVLSDFCVNSEAAIISTGGGAVLDPENRKLLQQNGWVVYLNVSPELLYKRLRFDKRRPLLQTEDREKKILDLFEARDPIYRQTAHWVIDNNSDQSSVKLAQHIFEAFKHWRATESMQTDHH